MNKFLLAAIAAATVSLGCGAALAQTSQAGSDYSAQAPWQFRNASERLVALQAAQSVVANRNGNLGGVGGAYGGGSGLGTAQGFGNYFSVTNNVSCSGEGGAIVTCNGGTNSVSGSTQTNSGNQTATNDITGNTVTTTNNQQGSAFGRGNVLNAAPNQ